MRNVVITLLICLIFFQLSGEQKGGFTKFILQKMDYDKAYFESILKMKKEGRKHPRLSTEEFTSETARASFNLPVLNKYVSQKELYLSGSPLTLPPLKEGYRVYINLIALLNMFQAFEKKNYNDALKYGEYIVVQNKESVGLTTEENTADYYVQLFREYYFLMAASHYHLKNDTKAVEWFAKIEADADLQKLKAQINEDKKQAADPKILRLEELRKKPLAVMEMLNADKNPENDWMTKGMTEVLTNELVQNTDILVVERSQLEKVYKEFELALSGVTTEADAIKIGEVLSAESLLVSSFQNSGQGLLFSFRIVDSQNGLALESVSGEIIKDDDMFRNIRGLVLDLFVRAGWMFPETANEIGESRVPKMTNIRELAQARLAMAASPKEAKAMYAKAAKEDPALANIFEDLKAEFKDVSATVAVTPFVNVTGNSEDFWMIGALVEMMTNDLPKLDFTVVERTQFDGLLNEKMGQVISSEDAVKAGQSAGADLLMMGSVFHLDKHIKIQARFVEIKTGIVLFTVESENREDNFSKAVVDLLKNIAENMNHKLSTDAIAGLSSAKISKEDFEKYTRQQIAKESLSKTDTKKKAETGYKYLPRWPFWVAVTTFSLGFATAISQFVIINLNHNDKNNNEEDRHIRDAFGWTGVTIAVVSAGYMIFDSAWQNKVTKERNKRSVLITPQINMVNGKGAGIIVSGSY